MYLCIKQKVQAICNLRFKHFFKWSATKENTIKTEKTFIVHPENTAQENALKAFMKALKMKFEIRKDQPYDPNFVDKIQKSREEFQEGKTLKVDLDEIWKE